MIDREVSIHTDRDREKTEREGQTGRQRNRQNDRQT